jgi:hypothetical protein
MEDVEAIAPKQIAGKKCECEKERDANVVTLAWLRKPLEDVEEQFYVPLNLKYLQSFDFCFIKYRWSKFSQPHRFCNPNTLSSSICNPNLLVSCVSTYVFVFLVNTSKAIYLQLMDYILFY